MCKIEKFQRNISTIFLKLLNIYYFLKIFQKVEIVMLRWNILQCLKKMLREYFSCNERLEIFLTYFCNILCYVGGLGYPKFAHGKIEWSPCSPDLSRCDFFLWGYIKVHCYSENPTTTEELMKAIRKTVNTISDEILSKVLYSIRKRIDCCSSGDGEQFENIYH